MFNITSVSVDTTSTPECLVVTASSGLQTWVATYDNHYKCASVEENDGRTWRKLCFRNSSVLSAIEVVDKRREMHDFDNNGNFVKLAEYDGERLQVCLELSTSGRIVYEETYVHFDYLKRRFDERTGALVQETYGDGNVTWHLNGTLASVHFSWNANQCDWKWYESGCVQSLCTQSYEKRDDITMNFADGERHEPSTYTAEVALTSSAPGILHKLGGVYTTSKLHGDIVTTGYTWLGKLVSQTVTFGTYKYGTNRLTENIKSCWLVDLRTKLLIFDLGWHENLRLARREVFSPARFRVDYYPSGYVQRYEANGVVTDFVDGALRDAIDTPTADVFAALPPRSILSSPLFLKRLELPPVTKSIMEVAAVSDECVVCMDAPKDTALLSCGHRCVCAACAKSLTETKAACPICRAPIVSITKVFLV